MAQTFDIRFARSAGLAGLLEAPANDYRWKGAGSLSIDAQGISIAVQRGLLTVFARHRSRRIAANNLLEIYREGDALRLEFSTPESARTVLPFWVRDSRAGAEIVRLLPTQHSIELEDPPGSTRRYRFDRRLAAMLAVGVVALVFGAAMLQRYLAPPEILSGTEESVVAGDFVAQEGARDATPETTIAPLATPADARGNPRVAVDLPASGMRAAVAAPTPSAIVELDPPDPFSSAETSEAAAAPLERAALSQRVEEARRRIVARRTPDGVIPIVPGDPGYEAARTELDIFLTECDALRMGRPSAESGISPTWWDVTTRIHNNPELDHPALWGLRDIELAISRSRRAAGDDLFADMLEARVREFVY